MNKHPFNHRAIALSSLNYQMSAEASPPERTVPVWIATTAFTIHPDIEIIGSIGRYQDQWYLISPDIRDDYDDSELQQVSWAHLYLGMTEDLQLFFLPVTEPWQGYTTSYRDSLFDIVDIASNQNWVTIAKNSAQKRWEVTSEKRARRKIRWPEFNIEDVLGSAFPDDYYICDEDSPAFRSFLRR